MTVVLEISQKYEKIHENIQNFVKISPPKKSGFNIINLVCTRLKGEPDIWSRVSSLMDHRKVPRRTKQPAPSFMGVRFHKISKKVLNLNFFCGFRLAFCKNKCKNSSTFSGFLFVTRGLYGNSYSFSAYSLHA